MKRIIKNSLLLIVLSTLLYSCDDFIEEDITSKKISLIAPVNNLTTIKLTHTFGWNELEDAEQYNLEIVEGTFSAVTDFVLDTTVGSNRFRTTLYPGNFEWRVRGENNGSETDYTTFSISIDSALDISTQEIVLRSPTDFAITSDTTITFEWDNLPNADEYLFEIYENSLTGVRVFGPEVETTNSIDVTILDEGTFVWTVQGRNAVPSSTGFSERTLIIDNTAPNQVNLVSPSNGQLLNDTVNTYSWTQGTNTGTALTDMISFYSDSLGNSLIKTVTIPAGITSHTDSIGMNHFWGVQSIDAAGNEGPFGELRRVNIAP